METLESIQKWAHDTFGQPTVQRTLLRAAEEFEEMLDAQEDDMLEEAADVIIVLLNAPGIIDIINDKMKINRNRQWNLQGDGTGYHVKDSE